jgi:hypothetical protein
VVSAIVPVVNQAAGVLAQIVGVENPLSAVLE